MNPTLVIRSRRKSIAIVIERDGSLAVRAPEWATDEQIREALERKRDWIREKQQLNRKLWNELRPKQFKDGERFLYLGKRYKLRIVEDQKARLAFREGFWLRRQALPEAEAVFERWYRRRAKRVLEERVRVYCRKHDLEVRKVRITGAQKRWGSCSSKGALSFTWRLVMAPVRIIDYVVIHELAHLTERNHSKRFWAKVAAYMPDYSKRRDWLKENGYKLNF